MILEITNPSDPYTMETEDWAAACLACIYLGQGAYGLREIGGEHRMPILRFGGAEEWARSEFGMELQAWAASVGRRAVADCMDSVLIGNARDRAVVAAALASMPDEADRRAFLAKRHDMERSSMNDIGWRAGEWAKELRGQLGKEGGA